MICFKDQTFCISKCANNVCPRKFTEQTKRDATKWWGNENAPVCLGNLSENCKDFIPIID